MGSGMMRGAGARTTAPGGSLRHGMGMMWLRVAPNTVPAGVVSLRVVNDGTLPHEVVVLPLPPGKAAGNRVVGAGGTVSEAGSLGEASRTCGAGSGQGIAPGAIGWTTVRLPPGPYELVCNFPGHYAAGMHTELDVTS
ncbi:hypothetical protein MUU72_31920 [Streptomyces sp. RS10V-4]|nr:hypothetical protein [Streptomyces rhizoryzae]